MRVMHISIHQSRAQKTVAWHVILARSQPPRYAAPPRAWCLRALPTEDISNPAVGLTELNQLLSSGAEDQATALATSLRDDGTLRAFGKATQVPKRAYTIEELRLNRIDTRSLISPTDASLNRVRTTLQASFLAGLTGAFLAHVADLGQLVQSIIVFAALLTADQVANAGGFEALLVDTAARVLDRHYARRVALHEAGHFLVAYLLGLLPRGYALSSLEAFRAQRVLNVQAGTQLCDADFQREVASGRLSSSSLDAYSCVALAGVATEWLRFGKAEGGVEDVRALDSLLQALRFTQAKVDAQVRWAVLNVVTLLRRHTKVQDALADAMAAGKPVGECIQIIEENMAGTQDI